MYSKSELIRLYKKETNLKVKERMLLVIKVKYDNIIPAYASDELNRSRPWGLYWLKRYREEGIKGLKNRPKSGRHPDIPEKIACEMQSELTYLQHELVLFPQSVCMVNESMLSYSQVVL